MNAGISPQQWKRALFVEIGRWTLLGAETCRPSSECTHLQHYAMADELARTAAADETIQVQVDGGTAGQQVIGTER